MLNAEIVTPPAAEPITLDEARHYLRVDHNLEDSVVSGMIVAAREWCETFTGRALITQTLRRRLDAFPAHGEAIYLPGGHVQSVTSLTYTAPDGTPAAMLDSAFEIDAWSPNSGSFLRLAPGITSWPLAREGTNQVHVLYVAGFGASGAQVPAVIVNAMRLHLGWSYANRESTSREPFSNLERALERMLMQYRLWE